jgi:hypothetical protein
VPPEPNQDEDTGREVDSDDSLDLEDPPQLPAVSSDIDIVLNNVSSNAMDRATFDLNKPYDEFLRQLGSILKKRTKLSTDALEDSRKIIRWRLTTTAKSQAKTQAKFFFLEEEENYEDIRKEVRAATKTNKNLHNKVLRLQVNINTDSQNTDASTAFAGLPSSEERGVVISFLIR